MAANLFYRDNNLMVAAGYESGHTIVSQLVDNESWQVLYLSQPHTQPVLSLDVDPNCSFFLTSSADANIAKNPMPMLNYMYGPEPPVGKASTRPKDSGSSGLSALFASANPVPVTVSASRKQIEVQTEPLKVIRTKHSGQQSLSIRSDGKIFATAGWDSKVRVYSVGSMKELAVLKWHKEGCYSVAFASIHDSSVQNGACLAEKGLDETSLITMTNSLSVKEQRLRKAKTTHWLAAGSKDGKLSLWDIY